MRIHRVKCFNRWFNEVTSGLKMFEVRRNDRDYQAGDLIELNETKDGEYTGRAAMFEAAYILQSSEFPDGIKDGFVIIGLKPVTGIYEDQGKGSV